MQLDCQGPKKKGGGSQSATKTCSYLNDVVLSFLYKRPHVLKALDKVLVIPEYASFYGSENISLSV